MIDELAIVLGAVFGSEVHRDESGLRTIVRSDEAWFATRVRLEPTAELFIHTRPVDGFELALKWNERWSEPDSEPAFDDAFGITDNDDALRRVWLDDAARKALLGSAYTYERDDLLNMDLVSIGKRTWTYELANDELIVTKGTREHDPNRVSAAILAGCALAGRSARWAREYAEIARQLGGRARSEIELGGLPLITANRSAIDVSLQLLRRLPGERNGRLRTLVTANRISHDEHTFSFVHEHAVRTMIPPLPKGDRKDEVGSYRVRATADTFEVDELTKKLVVAAQPGAVVGDLDSIDVWFDAAPMDVTRLDAAFALAAHLAIGGTAQQGPYR